MSAIRFKEKRVSYIASALAALILRYSAIKIVVIIIMIIIIIIG